MPEKSTVEAARKDIKEGKSASTAAGEFVRQEQEHVREGKHGARSPQQAIAIGLSEARRAGIPLKPPARGKASAATRERAERDYEKGKRIRVGVKTPTYQHIPFKMALYSFDGTLLIRLIPVHWLLRLLN
jgi:hypothetical protein